MSKGVDREINVGALATFAVVLLLVCAVSAVAMWYFSNFLGRYLASDDPPPPALAAAREPYAPPGPRLQAEPEREMADLREDEDAVLETYGWVDEAAGIARIPVERAIALAVGEEAAPAAATDERSPEDGGGGPLKYFGLCALAALLLGLPAGAQVQDNSLPAALRGVDFEQRLGADLPLDAVFTDSQGRERPLGDYFGDRPVLVSLVYYECPMLCSLVLNGLVSSLRAVDFDAGDAFDVVVVSFDSRETHTLAAAKKENYVKSYGRDDAAAGWHFLTGDEENIARLAEAIGFRWVYDEERDEFAHSAGVVVATPEGVLSRYFYGIEFPPRDLRLGLVEASDSKIGTFADQVLLFCFHYDPQTGRYSVATLNAVRAGGVLTVAAIAAFILMALRRERAQAARA